MKLRMSMQSGSVIGRSTASSWTVGLRMALFSPADRKLTALIPAPDLHHKGSRTWEDLGSGGLVEGLGVLGLLGGLGMGRPRWTTTQAYPV